MAASVVVVGDALLDVLVAPTEPMRLGADVPAAVRVSPGGQGANLAIRLARRGVAVELVCALGDDAAGRLLRETLAADGVGVRTLVAGATGTVIVLVDAAGERTMLSQRIALVDQLADVADAGSVAADWLVVSGYLLLEPSAADVVAHLRAWAPRRMLVGCAVPDDSLAAWQEAARALGPEVIVLNRDEAHRAPGLPADRLVITEPHGATAVIGDARARAGTPVGPSATDTTGAGDAFTAAFLAELMDTWPPGEGALQRALEAGGSAGAASTRVVGAQGRIPGERSGMVDR